MVERSLSMREVPGSIPGISKPFFVTFSRLNGRTAAMTLTIIAASKF